MATWKEWLQEKKVLIADGGWGTEFLSRGLGRGEVPESWNIQRRADVYAVAEAYVKAGADVILTNTFGGSSLKLAKAGLSDKTAEITRLGAEISREAAADRCLVFGSIGPTGEFMAPVGKITEADLVKAFAEQARALTAGGVDGIVIETMMDLGEARAALRAVKENTSLPVAVTMTFNKNPRGYATLMGNRPEQAVRELEKAGADIVGTNCGAGIEDMIEVTRQIRPATSLPIWCKPNAGLPQLVDGNTVYRETPDQMASRLKGLVEAGAKIIGGCCGTTPAFVRAFVLERSRLFAC
jgi:5-methyltetrahydrofolate--homocysteine methyltransferase